MLGVVALLVVYPVLLLVIHSFEVGPFGRETHLGLENWRAAFTETQLLSAILNTFALAVTRQILSMAIAVGVAWLLGTTDLPGARWLRDAGESPDQPEDAGWVEDEDADGFRYGRAAALRSDYY